MTWYSLPLTWAETKALSRNITTDISNINKQNNQKENKYKTKIVFCGKNYAYIVSNFNQSINQSTMLQPWTSWGRQIPYILPTLFRPMHSNHGPELGSTKGFILFTHNQVKKLLEGHLAMKSFYLFPEIFKYHFSLQKQKLIFFSNKSSFLVFISLYFES